MAYSLWAYSLLGPFKQMLSDDVLRWCLKLYKRFSRGLPFGWQDRPHYMKTLYFLSVAFAGRERVGKTLGRDPYYRDLDLAMAIRPWVSEENTETYKEWKKEWEEEMGDDLLPKPESTEGGRRVSVLKRQEGAPVNLG